MLFNVICGMMKPDSGSVIVEGVKLGEQSDFPANMGVFINPPGFIGIYSGFKNLKFLADIRGVMGDSQIREAMHKEIIRLLQAEGKSILLTSHNYEDIEQLCDAVYIMDNQKIVPVTDEPIGKYFSRKY